MKKVLLTALFSVVFVSMISAQEAVVTEVVKTEKACCKTKKKAECTEAKKAECKAKKAECKASSAAKKAECKDKKAECKDKKAECKDKKAECKMKAAKEAKSCKPGCTKPCCAAKAEKSSGVEGYACPMKCEKDKVYKKEGACPVCKMDLKKA
ncbi:MAG: hypothetical protein COB60_00120 [Flavobacteriaceae bacterium]|nr:MAG: hypothetical protein COB60_00120 [Flavobacteriaceae bacterium]